MHDAFECVAILEKLPLEIECIATSGDKLLVGTNKGHLLVYNIREDVTSRSIDQRFEVELQRSNKAFGRKPIMQLVVIKEYRNQGIGKQLINSCIVIAKEKNCHRIRLESGNKRKESHNFYKHLGFEQYALSFTLNLC